MTKFKVGDEVIYNYNGERSMLTRKIPEEEWFSGMWDAIGPYGDERIYKEDEITLAKQDTEVTEFKAGDVVKVLRHRNGYGDNLGTGEPVGQTVILSAIEPEINDDGSLGDFEAWNLKDSMYWVRSDDVELVSRPSEETSIDWEGLLLGKHETTHMAAKFKITREEFGVNIKIPKWHLWGTEDLIELGSHLFALAEYLETGTVDLSDDCIECENEHLRDSNERLASANEAKRQRLAKIRELTEV